MMTYDHGMVQSLIETSTGHPIVVVVITVLLSLQVLTGRGDMDNGSEASAISVDWNATILDSASGEVPPPPPTGNDSSVEFMQLFKLI